MNDETTTIPTEDLRALFDVAVNSLDFGSGFWDTEETEAARRIAVALGVDPIEATPTDLAKNYPHRYEQDDAVRWWCKCKRCLGKRDEPWHTSDEPTGGADE